jgi:glycosyltransferase involved in cell wall biosynthesis
MAGHLYIAWTRYQRRPISMQQDFGYELVFMPPVARGRLAKGALSYPVQTIRTLSLVLQRRPDVLWIQAPPNVLIHVAWLARLLRGGRLRLIADLHNAALSRFWFGVPLTRRLLNSFDVILVHNEVIRSNALGKGLAGDRVTVLEDRTPTIRAAARGVAPRPYFVMPCSFSQDEPVPAVIEAAARLPDIGFRITGDRRVAERRGYLRDLPGNVEFTGFLEAADYEALVSGCTAMLCLTTRDGIQLSAAVEAVGAGKPMVISDTPLLRSLFGAGLFTDNTPRSIADACRAVSEDYLHYENATLMLRDDNEREQRWQFQAETLKLQL